MKPNAALNFFNFRDHIHSSEVFNSTMFVTYFFTVAVAFIAMFPWIIHFFEPPHVVVGMHALKWFNNRETEYEGIQMESLRGKVAVITGGCSGIGFETVKELAYGGATVYFSSRSMPRLKDAVRQLQIMNSNVDLRPLSLDLADFSSIDEFVKHIPERVDYLVLNAGSYTSSIKTIHGYESMFMTNHIGHFYLANKISHKLHSNSRVVVVSSSLSLHVEFFDWDAFQDKKKAEYHGPMMMFAHTKLANDLFATQFQKLNPDVLVSVARPGIVDSEEFLGVYRHLCKILRFCFTPAQGAVPTLLGCVGKDSNLHRPALILPGGSHAWPEEWSYLMKDSKDAEKLWNYSEKVIATILGH